MTLRRRPAPRSPAAEPAAPGEKMIRDLAREVVRKATRLRNKADLVDHDRGRAGRNLTALRRTAEEMDVLLYQIRLRRCRACGCTEHEPCETDAGPCHWVAPDLCSACLGEAARAAGRKL